MQHWTQYWKTTATLSSFAEGRAAAGYDGELKAFWDNVYAHTPAQATVLDIGTGNGALALLASQYSAANKSGFTVHASDAAQIDPVTTFQGNQAVQSQLKTIQFHSEVPTEKLPFADSSIDLITSQFAFEYGDRDASLTEILRVLKPAGRAVIMAHHSESSLVMDSKLGLDITAYVLRETPLFIQADLLLRIAHQFLENTSSEEWQKSQHYYATTKTTQWIMQQLRERFAAEEQRVWVDDIIGRVARLMHNLPKLQKGETLPRLQRLAAEFDVLNAHSMRIEDQIKAAYDNQSANELIELVQKQGAQASAEPYSLALQENEQKTLFAMQIVISKPA